MKTLNKTIFVTLIGLFLISLYSGMATASFGVNASTLRDNCREALEQYDDADVKIDPFHVGLCYGFIEGVDETHLWVARMMSKDADNQEEVRKYFAYCLDKDVTQGQIARMVVKYLEDHPEKLHYSASSILMTVLMANFPCKAQKDSSTEMKSHE